MKEKQQRIAAFIDSLQIEDGTSEAFSTILPINLNAIGSGDNSGNCINEMSVQCDKSKNGGSCQNYSGACGHSSNKGSCLNTLYDRVPRNSCTGGGSVGP